MEEQFQQGTVVPPEAAAQIPQPATIEPAPSFDSAQDLRQESAPSFDSAQDLRPEMPTKPPRDFGFLKKIGVGVVVILLLGLAAFGIQKIFGSKSKDGNVTLTYWGLADEASTMAPLVAKFETENPGVKINYVKQSSQDYRERLLNSLSKGSGPDIFRFHNTWVPMFSNHLSTIPPEVIDTQTFQKDFYPVASQDLRRGVGLAGIPLEIDGLAMYVNVDIFEAEKKLVPATWDELRRVAGELTQRDKDGQITRAGVALGRTDNVDHWQDILGLMLLQNGADPANPNTTLGQDALAFFTVFSATDNIWDGTLPSSTQAFASGKTAIYFGPSWRAGGLKLANPNLRFKVVPMPQLPKSTPTQPNVNLANYWAEGVWSKSKGQTEAWKFLKFLSSQEVLSARYQFMTAAGLNGEPYSRTDMATQIIEDPYLGAYVQQGNSYKSWYMASSTFDGSTGLNSRLSAVYAKAVATALDNRTPEEALTPVAAEVGQILSGYGVK